MRLVLNRLDPKSLPMIPEDELANRTFGVMQVGETPFNVLERAFVPAGEGDDARYSKPFESCVPPGDYELVSRVSPKYGVRWHMVNEDLKIYLTKTLAKASGDPLARWSCMFHPFNFYHESFGCGGLGLRLANFAGRDGWGVPSSRDATRLFEDKLQQFPGASLTIRGPF